MKYLQVLAKKTYVQNGEEKTRWYRVGEVKITTGGGKYLKLFLYPNTDFIIVPEANAEQDDLPVID